uniref:Uncharacterized protein n=1 Tax=Mycena chlorophos TaxID=658473 RepID=A0ABQ0M5F7_MYCCL|nr:predicted protein [Mycena chlorophos]
MNRLRRQSHATTSDAGPSSPPNAVATRPPANGQPVISQTLRAALGLPLSTSEPELQPREVARPAFKSFATANEAVHPRTRVEQYWAARAFAAETTLLGYEHGELRRAKDQARHDARHAKLERLVLILLVLVATLVLGLLALTFSHSRSPSHHAKSPPAKHFTIPILSPFTSVVDRARNLRCRQHDAGRYRACVCSRRLRDVSALGWEALEVLETDEAVVFVGFRTPHAQSALSVRLAHLGAVGRSSPLRIAVTVLCSGPQQAGRRGSCWSSRCQGAGPGLGLQGIGVIESIVVSDVGLG